MMKYHIIIEIPHPMRDAGKYNTVVKKSIMLTLY